jgi:uncharacterized SAM-binding protein YcdF (DUF218 family)
MVRWHRPLFAVLVVTGLVLSRDLWLTAAGRFLDVSEAPGLADAAYVLGGGADSRPFLAGMLFRTGRVRRVLVPSFVAVPVEQARISFREDELICRVLKHYDVPDAAIVLLPGPVASTRDEAVALARFLEGEPETSVLVVTHVHHTRRTRLVFRQLLGKRAARVSFVGVPMDGFDAGNWWHSEKGIVAYPLEYSKLLATTVQLCPAACALLVLAVFVLLWWRRVIRLLYTLFVLCGLSRRGAETS